MFLIFFKAVIHNDTATQRDNNIFSGLFTHPWQLQSKQLLYQVPQNAIWRGNWPVQQRILLLLEAAERNISIFTSGLLTIVIYVTGPESYVHVDSQSIWICPTGISLVL